MRLPPLHPRLILALVVMVISASATAAVVLLTRDAGPSELRLKSEPQVRRLLSYDARGVLRRSMSAGVSREPESDAPQVHYHAELRLVIDGVLYTAPPQMGHPDDAGRFVAIHAHDGSGVVHLHRASSTRPYTVGQVFSVWGQLISPNGLGGFRFDRGMRGRLWINGTLAAWSSDHIIDDEDDIVVELVSPGFSLAGSPPLAPFDWKTASRLLQKGRSTKQDG